MMAFRYGAVWGVWMFVAGAALALPEATLTGQAGIRTPASKRIEDNSFLIEEAYNQESRIVQHIQAFSLLQNRTWSYSFTDEWPIGGRSHQLSVTIPFVKPSSEVSGNVGDILVNYRYQLLDTTSVAVAPRFSAALPSGRYQEGHGAGAVGAEMNLPVSVVLSRAFVAHLNVGGRFTPQGRGASGERGDLMNTNYGASLVWLAHAQFNILVEAVAGTSQTVEPGGRVSTARSLFINPGVRGAINVDDLQIVPGLSFPIGVGPSRGTYGVFAYLSFEHPY